MDIDNPAVLITAIMTTGVTVTFTIVVALRRNDAPNRIWAVGYCALAAAAWSACFLPSAADESGGPAAIVAGGITFFLAALSWGAALLQGQGGRAELVATVLAAACAIWTGVAAGDGIDGASTAAGATQLLCAGLGVVTCGVIGSAALRARVSARV